MTKREKEKRILPQVMKMDLLCITARDPSRYEFHGGIASREFFHPWQFALIAKHHRSGKEGGVSCTLKRKISVHCYSFPNRQRQ